MVKLGGESNMLWRCVVAQGWKPCEDLNVIENVWIDWKQAAFRTEAKKPD